VSNMQFSVSTSELVERTPQLSDGRFPPLDLWIFVATRLIERLNQGGVIAKREQGKFAGGESGFWSVYFGDVSEAYFGELLPKLKRGES